MQVYNYTLKISQAFNRLEHLILEYAAMKVLKYKPIPTVDARIQI